MVTPQKVQELSEPIESIYISMVNELLINIGRHITAPTWTHTADWEIQKLSELGQLTEENAAIINRRIKSIPAEVRETMTETRAAALAGIEQQLEKAAEDGYVTPPEGDSTMQVIQDYSAQALDKYNLVNTNMLNSSVDMYTQAILDTAASVREAEEKNQDLLARADATQTILNEAAGNVATGVETRTQAVRRAIRRISDEGLTGFVDRAGRSWTPEAYVNMVTRTTVHNTSVQSVKSRMQDYNTQVFQVSAHAGARPLCYPYQGKLYSWDNSAGVIELGNGRTMKYEPLNSTSYGQPAGLFGINCGHYPIPIIPGVSIPHAQEFVQPKEENDKAYAESQEQRDLERRIREAKRVVAMGDDSKEAKDRVKSLQQEMREFVDRTGRTRRYDREAMIAKPKSTPIEPGEQERLRTYNSNVVQERLLDSPVFEERFSGVTSSPEGDRKVYESAVEMLQHRSGTNREDLVLFDAETGDVIHKLTTSKRANAVTYDDATLEAIQLAHDNGLRVLAMHNHPGGLPPSLDDGSSAFDHGYDSGIAVGHNLEVWTYSPADQKYPESFSESVHETFNEMHQMQFSVDFDEEAWYDMLNQFGMEVTRK